VLFAKKKKKKKKKIVSVRSFVFFETLIFCGMSCIYEYSVVYKLHKKNKNKTFFLKDMKYSIA
jgi:cell division protein FtsW (lipid II flippase)